MMKTKVKTNQDVCVECGRPLTPEDKGEYCPHCTAARAGKVGKTGSLITKFGSTTLAVGSIVFAALRLIRKK